MTAQTAPKIAQTAQVKRTAVSAIIVIAGSMLSAALAAVANWIAANGLGAAGFGVFSLAVAVMTVVQEIGGPALDTAIVRHAAPLVTKSPQRAEAFFRAGIRLKWGISGTLAMALFLVADIVADAVFANRDLSPLIRWMAVCLLLANLSTSALTRLQSSERFLAHSALRVLANAVKVALLAGLLVAGALTPESAAIAWTLSFLLSYVAGTLVCRRWRSVPLPAPEDRPLHEIARFAGWVMLTGFLFAVHIRTDVLLLGYYGTAAEIGNYAVASNMMLLMDLVTSSLVITMLSKAAKARTAEQVTSLRKATSRMAIVISVAFLPLYIYAEPILLLLFPGFPDAVPAFRILFWSSIIVLLVYPLYLGFYAQNRPSKVSASYGLLAITSIVLGVFLVPAYGLIGAATTTLVARIVGALAILLLLMLERREHARP